MTFYFKFIYRQTIFDPIPFPKKMGKVSSEVISLIKGKKLKLSL